MPDDPRKSQEHRPSLVNMSVNSSRRSGQDETGKGSPARDTSRRNSTDSAKVPNQQIPRK
jgi:hypothetical protein